MPLIAASVVQDLAENLLEYLFHHLVILSSSFPLEGGEAHGRIRMTLLSMSTEKTGRSLTVCCFVLFLSMSLWYIRVILVVASVFLYATAPVTTLVFATFPIGLFYLFCVFITYIIAFAAIRKLVGVS